ncbi:hypothetical protein HaLaN_06206 [Haematococcus lacustris]|uniref:Uncharacterized protein n=1 Tax=Haematococcus lacustris TaxID=44745 RepID=A0A699YL95_HAELA|nr:hypothetical protein HaLaN_06206 [Haematococcus lacustris]
MSDAVERHSNLELQATNVNHLRLKRENVAPHPGTHWRLRNPQPGPEEDVDLECRDMKLRIHG